MLKSRSTQSKSSDLSTNIRSIARTLSNSDDTFQTAKKIGKLKASSEPLVIRGKGVVGNSDRVDFLKFTVQPGANFSSNQSTYKISGGKVKLQVFAKHPELTNNKNQSLGVRSLSGRSSFFDDQPTFNETSDPITVYIKVSTSSKKTVQYDIKTVYNLFQ